VKLRGCSRATHPTTASLNLLFFLTSLTIVAKYLKFTQFLNNLIFFTKSLFFTFRVMSLVSQPNLQHFATKVKYI
jgi:hypothetical protein